MQVQDFSGTLGRLCFAAEVLRHIKPFLAPLYSWASTKKRGSTWPLPKAIVAVMLWVAKQVSEQSHVALRPLVVEVDSFEISLRLEASGYEGLVVSMVKTWLM